MAERLTEAQREAILDVAAFVDSQESVILAWCNTRHHVQVSDAQVHRALRVLAHLDGLDEEQIATLLTVARVSASTDELIADAKHSDEVKTIAKYRRSAAANSAIVAALEVAHG